MKLQLCSRTNLPNVYADTFRAEIQKPDHKELKSNLLSIFEIGYLCGTHEKLSIPKAFSKILEISNYFDWEMITQEERRDLYMSLISNPEINLEEVINYKLETGSLGFVLTTRKQESLKESSINDGSLRRSRRPIIISEEVNGHILKSTITLCDQPFEEHKVREVACSEEKGAQEDLKSIEDKKYLEEQDLKTQRLIEQLLQEKEVAIMKESAIWSSKKDSKYIHEDMFRPRGIIEEIKLPEKQIPAFQYENGYGENSLNDQEALNQFEADRLLAEEISKQSIYQPGDDGPKCDICLEPLYSKDYAPVSDCPHFYHRECLHLFVKGEVYAKKAQIKCPDVKCSQILTPQDIEEFLDGKDLERYHNNQLDFYIASRSKDISYCPTLGCNYPFEHSGVSDFECPKCYNHYCLDCRVEYHEGQTCLEFKRDRVNNTFGKADEQFLQFVKGQNFKQCSNCKHWIERKEGCPHMTCRCGYQFCYRCGGRWGKCPCPP